MEPERHLYRFRSIDALLDEHHELERQEIFLQRFDRLNDPMEGCRQVVWEGDEILWRNFFRHYVLQLVYALRLCQINADLPWQPPDLRPELAVEDLKAAELRDLVRLIQREVVACDDVQRLIGILLALAGPLRFDNLRALLRLAHRRILYVSMKVLSRSKLVGPDAPGREPPPIVTESLAREIVELQRSESLDANLAALESRLNESALAKHLQYRGKDDAQAGLFLDLDFPAAFLDAIVELMHPSWRTACFSEGCRDASMWASYGDGHQGVALKFRTETRHGRRGLPAQGVTGSGWSHGRGHYPIRTSTWYEFHPVEYSSAPPVVEFFTSLGQLPTPKILSCWKRDPELGASTKLDTITGGDGDWQNEHWDRFRQATTRKFADWKHEREHRIIRPDMLGPREDKDSAIRYDFSSLAGLVFGIRTPPEAKFRILEIIRAKCIDTGRSSFELFQAVKAPSETSLDLSPLSPSLVCKARP